MGKVIRLTESDLIRLVKRVINEDSFSDFFKRKNDGEDQKIADKILSTIRNKPKKIKNLKRRTIYKTPEFEYVFITFKIDDSQEITSRQGYFHKISLFVGEDKINCDSQTAKDIYRELNKLES